MAEYTIYLTAGASTAITVEANDLEDAIERAFERTPHICGNCAGWGIEAGIDLGDWELDDEAAYSDYPEEKSE